MKFVDFKELFDLEGSIVGENAPQWAQVREEMRKTMFPSVYKGVGEDPFAEKVQYAMEVMDQLKHHKPGPGYLGKEPYRPGGPDYEKAKKARIAPERM
ncbi:MAG: hypothetical protein GY757_36330, partial [bacterium]|nr:hypothetical protein [bacterium]